MPRNWLTRDQGCHRVLAEEIPPDATARMVEDAISNWFSEGRSEKDTVVVYFAAHGGEIGKDPNRHFIYAANSDHSDPEGTAIETARLARRLFSGAGARPQNVLLILDTCHSGRGAGQAAAVVAHTKAAMQTGGSGFWVFASTEPQSLADDGAFVNAFLEAIRSEDCSPIRGGEFIDPTLLIEQINVLLSRKLAQEAEGDSTGFRRQFRFFRNINHVPRLDGVPLADEAHWSPKARGVEQFTSEGCFFTGRRAARRELVAWLLAPESDRRARVVTGSPGSGKSAVLAWLILWSHEAARRELEKDGVSLEADICPPVGSVDAAVHAHGASFETVVAQLATALGAAGVQVVDLLRAIAARPHPARIIVDALDEAAEPGRIERELLLPLAASSKVRLIVGSRLRSGGRAPLAGAAVVIDLDDAGRYFSREDIADYVERGCFVCATANTPGAPRMRGASPHSWPGAPACRSFSRGS